MERPTEKKQTSKPFDLAAYKKTAYTAKPLKANRVLPFPNFIQKGIGLEGIPWGGTVQVQGFSDTGKTTIAIEMAVQCQKQGGLPIFFITEGKFSWEHAALQGLEFDMVLDDNGNLIPEGNFIYIGDLENLEEMWNYMRKFLDDQRNGKLKADILFIVDAIGSIHCDTIKDGEGGGQHDARSIANNYQGDINQRVTSTKYVKHGDYFASTIFLNHVYLGRPAMPGGIPPLIAKGGNGIYASSDYVFLCGGKMTKGTRDLSMTMKGRNIVFGKESKISVLKNHSGGGISVNDFKVGLVPHGYIDLAELDTYKKRNKKYFDELLNHDSDEAEITILDTADVPEDQQ